jgi:hypothetical protein
MIARLSAIAAGAMLLLLSACSSLQTGKTSVGGSQVASAPSDQKCEVDVKRVCQELRKRPVVDSQTGLTYDRTEVEQNSQRTMTEFLPYQVPNGSMLEVQCEINSEHSTVVYAHLMPGGPPLTATDVAYLENAGYCAH